jgi:hypothetical protein
MENKKDMEFIQKVWEDVLDYEKSWLKSHSNSLVPVTKILDYFGVENICKLYGCSVATETIARELIYEAFK